MKQLDDTYARYTMAYNTIHGTLGAQRVSTFKNTVISDGQMTCQFYFLGPFAVKNAQGEDITPKSQKTCAMLAMLYLAPRASRTRVWLRDKLWSDRGEEQGASSLRQALLDARKCFKDLGVDIVSADKKSISLNMSVINSDIDQVLDPDSNASKQATLPKINTKTMHEDFLEGMDIRDLEFEEWLTLERQSWEQRVDSFLKKPAVKQELTSSGHSGYSANEQSEVGKRVMSTIVAITLKHAANFRNAKVFSDFIRTLQDLSANSGGRIYKLDQSHILLEFGRPYDAVNCAQDIAQHLAFESKSHEKAMSFDYGIGINSGLVYQVNNDISGTECEIAIAASERCQTGQILVTNSCIASAEGKVSCLFVKAGSVENAQIVQAIELSEIIGSRNTTNSKNTESESRQTSKNSHLSQSNENSTSCPSIGVMPFRTSDASVQDYMGEGLADDIIVALSSNHWLSVISRNSSFLYQYGEDEVSPGIGELNLDYLVSGSVKLLGANTDNMVNIVVTLERVESKHILWSESFNVALNDIMNVQATIATKITAQLLPELGKHEQVRAYHGNIDDLTTWELVHRGHWHMSRRTSTGVAKAKHFYESALEHDEFQTEALIALAWWYFFKAWSEHGISDASESYQKVTELCRKALFMDRTDSRVHAYLGAVAIMNVRPTKAIKHLDEAIRLNPSNAFAYSSRGSAHLMKGNAQLAPQDIRTALALDPSDYYRFHKLTELAAAYFLTKQYKKAIDAAESATFLSPRYWYARLIALASHAERDQHGDKEAAQEVKQAIRELKINVSEKNIRAIPYEDRTCIERLITLYEGVK